MNQKLGLIIEDFTILRYIDNFPFVCNKIYEIRYKYNYYKNVYIYLFETVKDVSSFLQMTVPTWMSGLAIDRFILLLNDINKPFYSNTIIHEFAHIAINHITKNKCPLWLNEGLAQYYSEEYKKITISSNSLKTIDVYKFTKETKLLYSVSAKLVYNLINKYGEINIIEKLSNITDFKNDEILGYSNIINEIKYI